MKGERPMLNRKLERDNAWKFADEIEKLLNNAPKQDGGQLLAKLQEWRESGMLAPAPSAARTVLQLYADWMAEYVCEKSQAPEKNPEDWKFPTQEMLESTPDLPKEFAKLFQENGDYAQYGRAVYETHQATRRLFRAAAAYAALRPGKKAAGDAAPEFQAMKQAADGVKELPMTFDVYSNQISPVERYARALSRNGRWQQQTSGTWRVPVEILQECGSPQEATLITLIYYRHLAGIQKVEGGFTDFYRIPQAETGIYLAGRDQPAAVQKLVEQVQQQQTAYERARNEHAEAHRRKHLRFTQLSLGPGDAKTYLAAISQAAFNAFQSCNKPEAKREDYLEISEEKPRDALEKLAEKPEEFEGSEGIKDFMTAAQYAGKVEHTVILAALKQRLDLEIWTPTWKNQQAKPAGPFRNASATWVLRLVMAAHWLANGQREEKAAVEPKELTALLETEDAFDQLERAKGEVFWWKPHYQMTLGREQTEDGKTRLYYRIFKKQKKQKPETAPEGPEGPCEAAEVPGDNLPPQKGGTV